MTAEIINARWAAIHERIALYLILIAMGGHIPHGGQYEPFQEFPAWSRSSEQMELNPMCMNYLQIDIFLFILNARFQLVKSNQINFILRPLSDEKQVTLE